jgi:hypothetical protein
MSFFSTILDLGKSAVNFLSGNSLGGNIAKTAITAFLLNKVNSSINKSNDAARTVTTTSPPVDPGTPLEIVPNQNNRIPVLYGEAFVPGIITDAQLSADRTVMTYVFTLSEATGTLLSTGLPSSYSFEDVYLNDQRVVFKSDGITVDYTLDREGSQDISARDLVTIRFYAGGSASSYQQGQEGGFPITEAMQENAWDVVPEWTSFHVMNQLIFAVITVTYNSNNGLRGVPRPLFHIINSMSQPGDVLYDYSTNTRYGAGIDPEDIYDE